MGRIDFMKGSFIGITLIMLFCSLMTPAMSISLSISGGTGGDFVSTSTSYALDGSTRLQERTVLSESQIVQSREAAGSGNNLIDQSMSGNEYNVNNVIGSSGSFSTSASTVASSTSIGLSQSLMGSGDLSTSIDGNTASGSSSQISEVTGGALSTTQTLAAAGSVYAGQDTQLSGDAGGIGSSSSSAENYINLAGGFSGQGNLEADLLAMASDRSFVYGDASFQGVSVLDDENMAVLASGEIGYSVEGLYAQPGGDLGTFGLSAVNLDKGSVDSDTSSLQEGPEITSEGGESASYSLNGRKWVQNDPQIKLYLKNDARLANEGLDRNVVSDTITDAANVWDDATNQNLFADTDLVRFTSDPATFSGRYDGKNVISWMPYVPGCTALASTGTWYRTTEIDGYHPIVECDIAFNSNYRWSNTGSNIDIQSVALHELGHMIGMGDIYNKAQFYRDSRQVMHYYTGVKHSLGNGDKTGVWKLYG
jgi:hypothetical protein